MNEEREQYDGLDPELASISGALDELGRVERRAAPGGLESRIFEHTRPTAPASGGVLARIGPGWRLAAAVGIGAIAVAGTWYAVQRGSSSAPGPASDFDMVAFEAEFETWLAELEEPMDDIESVDSGFSTVEAAYENFWTDPLALGEESL